MRNENVIVFPHIPKCGGSTVRHFLEQSGKRVFFDYDHPPSRVQWYRGGSEQRDRDFSLLDFSPFDVVYGHFPLKRYMTGDRVVLLLRHPVERLISNYYYWKDILPVTNRPAIARSPEIMAVKSGEMDIVEFAKRLKLGTVLEMYTDYVDTRNFMFVGFTDRLDDLLAKLADALGCDAASPQPQRVNGAKGEVSDEAIARLTGIARADIDWYEEQRRIWLGSA